MSERGYDIGEGYRYGFGGNEKDDEIKDAGNSYNTLERGYDPRLGRWLSIDPNVRRYPWQSSFAGYNNNPIYFIDPNGADGEATVDKQNKTVNITMNFYYDKSDPNMEKQAITADVNKKFGINELHFEAEITKIEKEGFESQPWKIKDDQGEEWTVNIQVNFIGLDNAASVEQKLQEDPLANKLVYDNDLPSAGLWDPNNRSLTIGSKRRLDSNGSTTTHEIGHGLSLPHSYSIPGASHFGAICGTDSDGGPGHNGSGDMSGGIMSYAQDRHIETAEVRMMVIKSINLAKTANENAIKIHIKGSDQWEPKIIK